MDLTAREKSRKHLTRRDFREKPLEEGYASLWMHVESSRRFYGRFFVVLPSFEICGQRHMRADDDLIGIEYLADGG
ncbi:MAG: hypothetical protein ACXVZX_05590, partial [Terriglobales bacterium]